MIFRGGSVSADFSIRRTSGPVEVLEPGGLPATPRKDLEMTTEPGFSSLEKLLAAILIVVVLAMMASGQSVSTLYEGVSPGTGA
jgi:hypothetical protein